MLRNDIIFKDTKNYFAIFVIITLILIITVILLTIYNYNPYYKISGIYDKELENVYFLIENDKLSDIKTAEIKIDNKIIDNKNIYVEDYISTDNKIYAKVLTHLEENIDNQVVIVSFKLPKTTILKRIWKGLIE